MLEVAKNFKSKNSVKEKNKEIKKSLIKKKNKKSKLMKKRR
jgi:hypothetical protein